MRIRILKSRILEHIVVGDVIEGILKYSMVLVWTFATTPWAWNLTSQIRKRPFTVPKNITLNIFTQFFMLMGYKVVNEVLHGNLRTQDYGRMNTNQ